MSVITLNNLSSSLKFSKLSSLYSSFCEIIHGGVAHFTFGVYCFPVKSKLSVALRALSIMNT